MARSISHAFFDKSYRSLPVPTPIYFHLLHGIELQFLTNNIDNDFRRSSEQPTIELRGGGSGNVAKSEAEACASQ